MTRLFLILALLAGVARADTPWEENVPKERQDEANKLFADANILFAKQAHAPALAKYRAAIALWDHPLIRYNMAVTLIRLDRLLDAADNLEHALRFGAAPFSDDLYRQALDYQKLINGRVGTLEATCGLAGARITLDGKSWFRCPDTRHVRMLSGEHMVVGEREGYLTLSKRVFITGGVTTQADIELRRPSTRWYQHWYVLAAAGLLVAGAGGTAIYFGSRDNASGIDVHGMTN